MSLWTNWIIDVTNWPDSWCFCPYEDDGSIVFGMNLIQDRCPGNLVGLIHLDGQKQAEVFCHAVPDWKERFGPLTITKP
jgi:hypothetical protein